MNKIIKKLIAITLCFLIPFEALSINRAKEKTADNLNNVSANQSESTPKKNQIKSPINFKIPAYLLTVGASFATLYKLLGPIGGKNSLSQKEKRFTNAGISNKKNEICFCNALLQILYSNISFRKFIDEINLDDLGKYDFSYEFGCCEAKAAVYLDQLNHTSDGTIGDYDKNPAKKQALFKRKVELFRELFKLMDKEDVVPKSFMRDFVYAVLTGFETANQGGVPYLCYFTYLHDIMQIYCQYYKITSPQCISGIFPGGFYFQSTSPLITMQNVLAPNASIEWWCGKQYQFINHSKIEAGNRRIVPLFDQFTVFAFLDLPKDSHFDSSRAGYEFTDPSGTTYVLTSALIHAARHAYAFKREADGNWYEYNDATVSPTSWEHVREKIATPPGGFSSPQGGAAFTFTTKAAFEQSSMRKAAQK